MLTTLGSLLAAAAVYLGVNLGHEQTQASRPDVQSAISDPGSTVDSIPFSTRAYWMRRANSALAELASPCPFAAFGTVIVNHTDRSGLGELVCMGVNAMREQGNPTLHGDTSTT